MTLKMKMTLMKKIMGTNRSVCAQLRTQGFCACGVSEWIVNKMDRKPLTPADVQQYYNSNVSHSSSYIEIQNGSIVF